MFFILSKLLLFLLSPAFWILTLLALSFVTKKDTRKKRLRLASLVLFLVFTNPALFNKIVRSWQPAHMPLPAGKHYSAAILLGGITMTDRHNNHFFGTDADRFIQTTKLYHSGIAGKILLTGGSPSLFKENKVPEADQLKQELLQQGVADTDIIIENRSRNTFENALFAKRMLDSFRLPPPYIVVTSATHIPRAKAVFEKAGMQVVMFPAAYKQVDHRKDPGDYLIPDTNLLSGWSIFLKEVVGLLVYRITGKA